MGTYEIVAVLRPDLDDEGLGARLERISERITEHGGRVTSLDRWGKRRLAYPIQKHRDGYYALFVFTLESNHITPLRQVLGLNEDLLRFVFASHHAKPAPAAAPATQAAASPAPTPTSTTPAPASATPAPPAPAPAAAPAPGTTEPQGQATPTGDTGHV